MSPRSLLFSSNQETSRQISQALLELDFGVDSYREIFAALEKMSTCHYDVVVVDGGEGAESAFLLETVRGLKYTPEIFTVLLALSGGAAANPAPATLVLRPPFASQQIKYDLLASDAFLAGMRSWLSPSPAEQAAPTLEIEMEEERKKAEAENQSAPPPLALPPSPELFAVRAPMLPPSPVFAPFDPEEDGLSPLESLFEAANAQAQRSEKTSWALPLLLGALLAAGLWLADRVFADHPWRETVASTASGASRPAAPAKRSLRSARGNAPPAPGSARRGPSLAPGEDRAGVENIRVESIGTPGARGNQAPLQPGLLSRRPPASPETGMQAEHSGSLPSSAATLAPAEAGIPPSLSAGSASRTAEGPAAPALPLAQPLLPVTLTGEVADKLLLQKTQPSYPELALKARLQGSVVLEALIGTDGMIRDLKLLSGSMLLGKAACDAVRQWRYQPLLRNGHAVEAQTLVTVDFKLP